MLLQEFELLALVLPRSYMLCLFLVQFQLVDFDSLTFGVRLVKQQDLICSLSVVNLGEDFV
jgi:hypothetical protein